MFPHSYLIKNTLDFTKVKLIFGYYVTYIVFYVL